MIDLSLVLLDDIYEELKKRYEAFIIATVKNLDDKSESIDVRYAGGKTNAIGLAEWTKSRVIGEMDLEADEGEKTHG